MSSGCDREGTLPAMIGSGLLFLACAGLYLFDEGVDRNVRRRGARS